MPSKHVVIAAIVALCVGFQLGIFYSTKATNLGYFTRNAFNLAPHQPPDDARHTLLQKSLLKALRSLTFAHRFARSGRTISGIATSFQELYTLYASITNDIAGGIEPLNPKENFLTNLSRSDPSFVPDVCPEVWHGTSFGYPFYDRGHELIENCTGTPVSELVTIIAYFSLDTSPVNKVLTGIWATHPTIPVIVVASDALKSTFTNVTRVSTGKKPLDVALNEAVSKVHTKYSLIARNLVHFNNQTRLERLIRMVNVAGADIAAGAPRNHTGHWERGCFQMKLQNYAFKVIEGYDISYNSCILCDYSSGPFLAQTNLLKEANFESAVHDGELVFVDFFLKLQKAGKVTLTCPDAMFYVREKSLLSYMSKADWKPFATKHKLNTVYLPSLRNEDLSLTHVKHEFSCADIKFTCTRPKSMANMPCCNQILSDMLKYLFRKGIEHGLQLEIEAGTNVGAVKMSGILPWELDADLDYLAKGKGQTVWKSLIPQFRKDGYGLSEDKKCYPPYPNGTVNCGYFAYRKAPFRIEMWGALWMAQWEQDVANVTSTKIEIDGFWYPTYPNPAKSARSHYGDDIYQHVEHWINLGHKSGWVPYKSGSWLKCTKPGFHACLDQFLPVGTIQFQEPWV